MLLSVGSTGGLRPCCNSTNSVIYKNEGTDEVVKIHEETDYSKNLLTGYTHDFLRKEMLKGNKPSICDRCWKMEDSGAKSFRQATNARYPDLYSSIKDPSPLGIYRIEFDLGKKCNLRCRMCGPQSSSLIGKEIQQYPQSAQYYEWKYDDFDWVDVVDIKQLVAPHIETLREIYLIGGEPLIIDAHSELLEYLVSSGISKNIRLIYNTNGTVIGKKFIELWKQFQFVQLGISVDGMGKYYEYIRNPFKWSSIEENILLLRDLIKDYNNIDYSISTTIQNLTLPCLAEFYQWADRHSIRIANIPVNYPEFLQPDVMPEKYFDQFVEKIRNIKQITGINAENIKQCLMLLENKSNVNNITLQKRFVDKQKLLDVVRKQNLFETHPWAIEIYETV